MRRLLLAALLCALALPAWAQIGLTGAGGFKPTAAGATNIAFNSAADLGNNGGSGNFSASYTSGSGSHRLLVACIAGDDSTGTDSITGVTYNSVAMTLGAKKQVTGARWTYVYYLLNPASGANTLAITQTGGNFLVVGAADYTGVKQSGQPDATATNDTGGSHATSLTTSVTTVADKSWAIMCDQGPDKQATAGTGATRRAVDAAFADWAIFDSNGAITPAGSYSMTALTTDGSSQIMGQVIVSFSPG